jgi:hypothetical protein
MQLPPRRTKRIQRIGGLEHALGTPGGFAADQAVESAIETLQTSNIVQLR